jgi:hypothetical protein
MPVIVLWLLAAAAPAAPVDAPPLRTAALAGDWKAVQAMGRGTLPELVRLYAQGLVHALDDPKLQVRQVALQALSILTGQTKGFEPGGTPQDRKAAVEDWRRWLAEYRASL